MKITETVHLIRQEFHVTPEVKRFIKIYLIIGESCYLIDSGVVGSKKLIDEYLQSIGSMSYIFGDDFAFTGDAIPVSHDLPIFVDYEENIYSLDRINELSEVQYFFV